MKVYIDTNTYLSYVSPTSGIKSLEKLKGLIQKGKIELVLTSQTKIEFLRNLKGRIKQEDKYTKDETKYDLPSELKGKKPAEYNPGEKAIAKKIDSLNADLVRNRKRRIAEYNKHIKLVEKLVKEIFTLATFYEYTDDTVTRAVVRYAKGLPPRKNDEKFGDSIVWETLKENIKNEDLVVISYDNDYRENGEEKISKILSAEWKKHTKKQLSLHFLLGNFLNRIEKTNKISNKIIEEETEQANTIAVGKNQFIYINPSTQFYAPVNDNYLIKINENNHIFSQKPELNRLIINPDNSILNGNTFVVPSGLNTVKLTNLEGLNQYQHIVTRKCRNCKKDLGNSLNAIYSDLCDNCRKTGAVDITL